MKKQLTHTTLAFLFSVLFLILNQAAHAQLVVYSPATSGYTNGGPSSMAAISVSPNITAGSLIKAPTIPTTALCPVNSFGARSWTASTTIPPLFISDLTFSLTANSGTLSLSSFTLAYGRSGSTSPASGALQYAIGAGSYVTVSTFTYPASTNTIVPAINLSTVTALQNVPAGAIINFRLANYNAASVNGAWYLLNNGIGLNGSLVGAVTPTPSVSIIQTSSIQCNGQSAGALQANVSGGTSPYTYSWMPAGGTFSTVSGLAAGVYNCLITDAASQTAIATYTLTEPAAVVLTTSASNSVICESNSITLTASGANTYTWSNGITNGAAFTPTLTTTYSVNATDANGCPGFATISVTMNPAPVITVNSGAICPGDSFTLSPSGAGTYTFSGGAAVVSPAGTSSYTITGTSAQGCPWLVPAVATVSVASNLSVTITGPASVCIGQPAFLTANGASTYTWSTGATTGTIAPVLTAGASYTVKGASGSCSSIATGSVGINPLPVVSASGPSTVCAGAQTTLSAGGAFSYSWSAGITGSAAVVNPAGNAAYTVTGTDMNGCSNTATLALTASPLPTVSISGGTICSGNSFTLSPSGAQTYTFSGGPAVSPTTTTSYSVTGTSSLGCVSASAAVASIVVYTLPIVTVNSGTICAGKTFTMVPGGAINYTYSNGSNTVTPAASISYTVTGSNTQGCIATAVSNVSVLPNPTISVNSGTSCPAKVFTLTPTGAVSYTFLNAGSTQVSPASSVSYSVIGTSSLGCVSPSPAISNVTVYPTPTISASGGSICAGGSFTITPSGALTYTYSAGQVVAPATSTSYYVYGTSSLGCTSIGAAQVNVTVVPGPTIGVNSGSICAGNVFTITPTGAASYTFVNGSTTVSPVSNTSYSVSGSNTAGCQSVNHAISNVTVYALPTPSVSGPANVCEGFSISLSVSGVPNYTWNTGATSSVIADTPAASTVYSVIAQSANGCMGSAFYPVTVNPTPTITISNAQICPGDSYTLNPSGADTYTFSGGSQTVSPANTTSYSVAGTSSAGCVSTVAAVAVITVTNSVNVSVSGPTVICSGEELSLTASGASSYTWSTGASGATLNITPTTTTLYVVTGGAGNCTNSAVLSLSVVPGPSITVPLQHTVICRGESTTLTAMGAQSYTWNTGATASLIVVTPSITTSYTVTGINQAGCAETVSITQQVVADCTDGIEETVSGSVRFAFYPNPNNGSFTIEGGGSAKLLLINELGQTIGEMELNSANQFRASVSGLDPGIYFIKSANNTTAGWRKIVVTH